MYRMMLFFLLSLSLGAAGQQRDSLREKKSLVSFGIGFLSSDISVERFISPPHMRMSVGGGIRMSYLPSESSYQDYKAYADGKVPTSYDYRRDEYGQGWTSLFVSVDIRYYFSSSIRNYVVLPNRGPYLCLKYILTGKSFETFEEGDLYVPPPSYTPNKYFSRYRSTHRIGLIFGVRTFMGKKQRFMFGAEAGLGPTINYNFSQSVTTAFANFRFGVVLGRF